MCQCLVWVRGSTVVAVRVYVCVWVGGYLIIYFVKILWNLSSLGSVSPLVIITTYSIPTLRNNRFDVVEH